MTRQHNKKSVGLTILTAILIGMALGFTDLSEQNHADTLVHEFGELLDGVESEILAIPNDTSSTTDTTVTIPTEMIQSQYAHLKAFDEVIIQQIL